ncbi:MAG: Ig-like domain-containing protein [Acidobacteria bacterium]|nr:Ig-like domain-containing protein [Acidobacteriota bacterium]
MKIKLRSLLFPARFASKRIGYAALLAAATLTCASLSLALWRPASFAAKPNQQQPCPHCAAKSNQIIYIPLIDLPEAQGSELVFNSRSPQEMEVTPTFYKLDGTAIVGKSVNVKSAEIRYVDLKKLIPGQYRDDIDWGGMSLAYTGVTREMWAQFRLLGVNGGGSVDEFFTVPSEVRSDLQEAVWWTPPNSTSIIALGNITDAATSATVRFGDGQEQAVYLAPHATEVIRHVPRSRASGESVAVNVAGAAGSVIPTGVIASADGSFNSVIRFYETKLAKQSDLFGNGLRLAGATPHLILKNTSPAAIKATPKFIPLAGSAAGGSVELPAIAIGPNQTVEVGLNALLNAVQNRRDLDTASVTVSNSGAPGSLIGMLYSSDKTTGVNYEVPLRDSGPARSMTGAYPLKISDDYTTIVYLTNISASPTEFVAQINYDDGKYVLGIRKLAAGETAVFDMKQMIAEQKPDDGNRHLPKSLQSGQFKWVERGTTGGKIVLIGRAEMVSRSQRISTSYSCAENCLASHWGGITPTSMVAIVGSEHAMSAWEMGGYASGSTIGPYSASGTWSSNNTSIATITNVGNCSAVAPGQATINLASDFFDVYSWDGLDCVYMGPSQWDSDSEMTVKPSLSGPSEVWNFTNVGSPNSNYPIQITLTAQPSNAASYTWTITNGTDKIRFTDNSTSITTTSNQVTIKSLGLRSSMQNDCSVTVTVSGQASSAHTVTNVVPHRLSLQSVDDQGASFPSVGYNSVWHYQILDQFGRMLPAAIPANEYFTSATMSATSNDWPTFTANGTNNANPADYTDSIGISGVIFYYSPNPTSPQSPLSTQLIQYANQSHQVGHQAPGSGRVVQTDQLRKYIDHGAHESITSPVN